MLFRSVNGINGIKVNSYKKMSSAIINLINNKSMQKKLSNNAIILSKKFSWQTIASYWHNYLKKIYLDENKLIT